MLVVQRITTEWTKISRGGDGATKRNVTPIAMELPPLAGVSSNYLLHNIRYHEWKDFAYQADVVELDASTHIRIEPVFLQFTENVVEVRFVWSWHHCGAPERDSHDLFRLSLGQWGRFTCNGRFGAQTLCGSEWRYHKTVFNIAVIDEFDENLFIATSPNAEGSRLAQLK